MSDEAMERKTLLGFIVSVGLLILVSAVAIVGRPKRPSEHRRHA